MILDLDALLTHEKARGAAASAVSGAAAASLNLVGATALGMSPLASAALFLYLIGSVFGYSLDILFAKRDFRVSPGAAPSPLPYSALGARAGWLLRSFGRRFFFRFVITVLIETLTGIAVTRAAIATLDRRALLVRTPEQKKLRDAAVAIAAAVLVFLLFGNVLRFDWAYREVEDPTLSIVVLAWLAITLLASALAVPASHATSS